VCGSQDDDLDSPTLFLVLLLLLLRQMRWSQWRGAQGAQRRLQKLRSSAAAAAAGAEEVAQAESWALTQDDARVQCVHALQKILADQQMVGKQPWSVTPAAD